MKETNLFSSPDVEVIEPRQATREELLLFHDQDYVDLIEDVSKSGEGFLDLGDTPAFEGCYEASALAAGASLSAVDAVMSGKAKHAMNIAGGLHHAHPSRASGFCIFNDPAITIAYLKKKYAIEKILYLDVDAHHGDGVMYGFYSDAGVLDIDFHEDGHHLFPGTGSTEETGEGEAVGTKVNVPLLPFTGNEPYMSLFREIVPKLVRKYLPNVLLLQCGADAHANDLLAHLQLTTKAYNEVADTMHRLAHELADGRLIVFGGGGYNQANVARTWTLVASTLVHHTPPKDVPEHWQRLFEALVGEKAPLKLSTDGEAKNELTDASTLKQTDEISNDLRRRIPSLA
jgi:acetoin utilization protein AcuC